MIIKIPVIEIKQDDNVFFVGKMQAYDLINIATTKVRKAYEPGVKHTYIEEVKGMLESPVSNESIRRVKELEDSENIQREQSITRLKEIGKYIEKANSIIPNAIICNLSPYIDYEDRDIEEFVKIDDYCISFDTDYIELSIIDGQHRLGGFGYVNDPDKYMDNYELVVSIMVGLKPTQQAELFATINGKQKSVSKSVLYDLSCMSENEYSEQMTAHLITSWFNVTPQSPLIGKIKMLGVGKGTISQSAMIDAIVPLFSGGKRRKINSADDGLYLPVFEKKYKDKDVEYILQRLYDYFRCVSEIFPEEWNWVQKRKQTNSIMNRSTGIVGLLMAYPSIYLVLKKNGAENDYLELRRLIGRAKETDFKPYSDIYDGGGQSIQKRFAIDFIKAIDIYDEAFKLRAKY